MPKSVTPSVETFKVIKTISKYWVKLTYHWAWASEGGQGE